MLKTAKEHAKEKIDKDKARNAMYDDIEKSKPCKNWSATMPAFCFTELCPERKYRRKHNGEM